VTGCGNASEIAAPIVRFRQPARLNIVPARRRPSELRIGHVAAARGTSDYHALVTNMVSAASFQ